MSRYLTDFLPAATNPIEISMDLTTHLEQGKLETQITGRISENPKKKVVNILAEFVPKRLSALLC